MSRFEGAATYYERQLRGYAKGLGARNKRTVKAAETLSKTLDKLGKSEEASKLREEYGVANK